MEFGFELFVSEKTGKKMVFVSADDGASGAEYPYETAEDIGKAVAAYISQYYPKAVEISNYGDIFITDIVWDIYDWEAEEEVITALPNTYEISISDILRSWERVEDFSDEEIMDRVVDFLTDEFGFCIESLHIELNKNC